VTVEEALLALLAFLAGILLFFGLAQALGSSPPRHARQRDHHSPDPSRHRLRAPTVAESAWESSLRAERRLDRHSEPAGEQPTETAASGGPRKIPAVEVPPLSPPTLTLTDDPGPAEPSGVDAEAVKAPVGLPASAEPDVALVEVCASLFLAGKHAELLVAAERGLGRRDGSSSIRSHHAMTGLWSVVALSHQTLGNEAQARAAFAAALRVVPGSVVLGCPPRLAATCVPIARRLLEMATLSPEGAEDRIVAPRLAMFWLQWRLIAAPGDHGAQAILEAAREALSEGHADVATGLIQRGEWTDAHRYIQQARETGDLFVARGELLVEILAASLRHEIERLTAAVIRGARDEARAVGALDRAETMLASMVDTGLPPRQWVAMTRRVWRGYAKLGTHRLKAGNLDGAADALFHALGMKEIGRQRRRQVREAVVRTLDAMSDEKVQTITRLLADGDRPAAVEHVERLISHVQRAREGGVAQADLAPVATKARQLAQQIEGPPAR
jgi:hypothetical protein